MSVVTRNTRKKVTNIVDRLGQIAQEIRVEAGGGQSDLLDAVKEARAILDDAVTKPDTDVV